jgi:hypothetical protein
VLGVLLAPAPLGVHRSGLDAGDHPDVAFRRPCEGAGDLPAHRLASLCDHLTGIVRRILVIQRGQAIEVAGVERLKPRADKLERIGRHRVEVFYVLRGASGAGRRGPGKRSDEERGEAAPDKE